MNKIIGVWGGSRSLRLESECKELNIQQGDEVKITTEENKIIIEKQIPIFKVNSGVEFKIKK